MANSGIANLISGINTVQNALNVNGTATQGQGFNVPPTYEANGNGLPYSNVPENNPGQLKRNIITWFVPQFGIVSMYVNPQKIIYLHKKLITQERTKGGYTLQYWGEELDTLRISGNTGSAGFEGINVLYEIYRAEQYAFDAVGLTLAANNASTDLSNTLSSVGASLGGIGSIGGIVGAVAGGAIGGILGMDSPNSNLAMSNIDSLAQLAFTVEMYYSGLVYRGFFESMEVHESATNFLLEYDMTFKVTQRRGYRTNIFPWQVSPKNPSGPYSQHSFNGQVDTSF
jgi:hypothetical protein